MLGVDTMDIRSKFCLKRMTSRSCHKVFSECHPPPLAFSSLVPARNHHHRKRARASQVRASCLKKASPSLVDEEGEAESRLNARAAISRRALMAILGSP